MIICRKKKRLKKRSLSKILAAPMPIIGYDDLRRERANMSASAPTPLTRCIVYGRMGYAHMDDKMYVCAGVQARFMQESVRCCSRERLRRRRDKATRHFLRRAALR